MPPASPPRRSPYVYAVLAAILLLAAFLNFYRLSQEGFANLYYAAAVQSMLSSWHNFFFVSFDAGGFVSVDKPPLGLWVQAGSALLFGFKGWSLLLPQALAGVLSVALLYHLVQPVFGQLAGLVAALVLALTPISVAANRNNTMDSLLVLTSLLAAWAAGKAAGSSRLRWLVLCAALVGVGFNIKMLQAFLVLPAFFLLYLAAARLPLWKRLAHLAVASLVVMVISLSWAIIVDLTPPGQRPYVGSSQNNTVMELVTGHNGARRLGMIAALLGLDSGPSPRPGLPAGQPGGTNDPGAHPAAPEPGAFPPAGPPLTPPPGVVRPSVQPGTPLTPGSQPPALSNQIPGAPQPPPGVNSPIGPASSPTTYRISHPGPGNETGQPGIWRLFNRQLAGQISWFLPFAILSLLPAVWQSQFTWPLSRRHQALLLWAAWLLPQAIFFSFAGLFHRYYLEMMAPAIAALSGAGLAAMWENYRYCLETSRPNWRGWILPAALLLATATEVVILLPFPNWAAWLLPLILVVALLCVAALIYLLLRARNFPPAVESPESSSGTLPAACSPASSAPQLARHPRSIACFLLLFTSLALLTAPTIWSLTPVINGGDTGLPFAGPELLERPPQPRSPDVSRLVEYLLAHHGSEKYILATPNSQSAAPVILATGQPVMALGGFSGNDNILTIDQLNSLVAGGEIRYFLLSVPVQLPGPDSPPTTVPLRPGNPPLAQPPNRLQQGLSPAPQGAIRRPNIPTGAAPSPAISQPQSAKVLEWARQNCRPVPDTAWKMVPGAQGIPTPGDPGGAQRLWDCKPPGS